MTHKKILEMKNFKRYVLVDFCQYYPRGFEGDVADRFETIKEAKVRYADGDFRYSDYTYIFDLVDWEVVHDFK